MPLKQIISCFDTIWKKNENDIANIKKKKKKKNVFIKKINITLKNQNDLEKLHLGCQEVEIKLRFSSSLLLLCIYMKLLHTKTKQEGRIWNFQGHLRIASKLSRSWLKTTWNFQRSLRKNHVEFPEVLVLGLINSEGCNTTFWSL